MRKTWPHPHQFRHVLVIGGGDPRKNPEAVITAHARSKVMQDGIGVPLVVAGNYAENDGQAFRAFAAAAGGRAELVEVPGHVSDEQLLKLYGESLALVAPSHDEGFSIPLIEGMAAGVPCFASDISAHAELVTDPDCRFLPDETQPCVRYWNGWRRTPSGESDFGAAIEGLASIPSPGGCGPVLGALCQVG